MSSSSFPRSSHKRLKPSPSSPLPSSLPPSSSSLALNTSLQSLCRSKNGKSCLNLYLTSPSPTDSHHASIVLNSLVRSGLILEAEKFLKTIENNMKVTTQAYTCMIKGYVHSGDLVSAKRIIDKMFKSKRFQPNVRTINTFLRGGMWSGGGGVGGLVGEVWKRYGGERDGSSYEYYVEAMAAAVRVEAAKKATSEYVKKICGWGETYESVTNFKNVEEFGETFVSCLTAIARAMSLLGESSALINPVIDKAMECVTSLKETLSSAVSLSAPSNNPSPKPSHKPGGKRGRAKDPTFDSTRSESNRLFRAHKLNSMVSELTFLKERDSTKWTKKHLKNAMKTRLFILSSGGTTDHDNSKNPIATNSEVLENLSSFGSHILSKSNSENFYDNLISPTTQQIDFDKVFPNPGPLHIELGSGTGSWICNLASKNPSKNYVSLELRTSRVSQTFSHSCLLTPPLHNLCCVSDLSLQFLASRLNQTTAEIYVNHPEPPNQSASDSDADHMLNDPTLRSIYDKLKPSGRLIIVSDNLAYARLLCKNIGGLISSRSVNFNNDSSVVVGSSELRLGESVRFKGGRGIDLLRGHPGKSLGFEEGGESYFDGLWKTGAGSHASKSERYVICLKKCDLAEEVVKEEKKLGERMASGGGAKKNKKKSAAKQARRNAKRLMKAKEGGGEEGLGASASPPASTSPALPPPGSEKTKEELKRERKLARRAQRRAEAEAAAA
ncbi:hypothetical protein TrST_g6923 [Triparma strigata]|uniref:tRNA (guanine(46)-N(7))-methyltransferase n=1 Tax=Triparma strigata TaxID=1606541 RepID=A0A9W7BKE8_9STRA|nr:hypothetical protein TrST_g6923 [Triparma strigata]